LSCVVYGRWRASDRHRQGRYSGRRKVELWFVHTILHTFAAAKENQPNAIKIDEETADFA